MLLLLLRHLLRPSSAASPFSSRNKRNRRAPDYFGFESSVCSVSDDSAAPAPKKQKSANPVIATVIQEEAAQPSVPETYYELQVVSPPAPPPVGTWSPESYDYEDYTREISLSVFDAENQIHAKDNYVKFVKLLNVLILISFIVHY